MGIFTPTPMQELNSDNFFKDSNEAPESSGSNSLFNYFFGKSHPVPGLTAILHYKDSEGYKLDPSSSNIILYTSKDFKGKGFFDTAITYIAQKLNYNLISIEVNSSTLFDRNLPQTVIGNIIFTREEIQEAFIKTIFGDYSKKKSLGVDSPLFSDEINFCNEIWDLAGRLTEFIEKSGKLSRLKNWTYGKVFGVLG